MQGSLGAIDVLILVLYGCVFGLIDRSRGA